jgi:predicted phage replisome organizer
MFEKRRFYLMAEGRKYYWLKLDRNFFKRHDIRVIESMDNGKDYVLFYLKLLVESIDHEGQLRFSQTIPYDEKMLATITNMNVDIC